MKGTLSVQTNTMCKGGNDVWGVKINAFNPDKQLSSDNGINGIYAQRCAGIFLDFYYF